MKNTIKAMTEIDGKTFKYLSLYGIAFFIVMYALTQIFTAVSKIISTSMMAKLGISSVSQVTRDIITAHASDINSLVWVFILATIAFIVLEIYNYVFFENLMWNTIFKHKTTFSNTNKFLWLNLLLFLSLGLGMAAVFVITSIFKGSFEPIGKILFYACMLFAVYLLYVGYVSFGRTHKILASVRNAFVIGFTKIRITIIPLIISFALSFVIGIALNAFSSVPDFISVSIQAIVLSVYLAWFRIMLANVLKSVKF